VNLLIIEDEPDLSKSIVTYLQQSRFTCETAHDYQTALHKVLPNNYDCIILDLNLPGGNGLHLLQKIKQQNKADGVLIISAKNSIDDKINGLEIGADDYLGKPFHLGELSARVNAIIRRKSFNGNNTIVLGRLTLNILDKYVKTDSSQLDLTHKEYELLLYFASNKNRVVTKESIIEHLWGAHVNMPDTYDFIYSHIKNLRKKLAEAGCPDYIKSIYGMGYKFCIEETTS